MPSPAVSAQAWQFPAGDELFNSMAFGHSPSTIDHTANVIRRADRRSRSLETEALWLEGDWGEEGYGYRATPSYRLCLRLDGGRGVIFPCSHRLSHRGRATIFSD